MTNEHPAAALEPIIRTAIQAAQGLLPFDQFMELALYAPGAGYYVNGSRKLGATGDFTTAPELSPLFSECIANQCVELLSALTQGEILEMGAGSGRMAASILQHLHTLDALPERYLILDTSPDLQATQRAWLQHTIPDVLPCVEWLQTLPEPGWNGVVLANEVLDAFPVHRVQFTGSNWQEGFVAWQDNQFLTVWASIQSPGLAAAVQQIPTKHLVAGYQTELNLRLSPWLATINQSMAQGAILLIDYGYTDAEYYHPERTTGTLQCYHRHQANTELYQRIGQQDITAHINFSSLAHAALDQGLNLAGYTTQAHFLFNNGLEALLTTALDQAMEPDLNVLAAVKQLTLPTTMGERFQAIGFNKKIDLTWQGFLNNDRRAYL